MKHQPATPSAPPTAATPDATAARPGTTGLPDTPFGNDLVSFLSLEQLDRDLFRGWCHAGLPLRAFGGQVAAQALTAAGRTVDAGREVHSLHGYFLRGGDTRTPIIYQVERLRDGRSYLSRRVTAVQAGVPIFTLSASFKTPEPDEGRQQHMPLVPAPEELPDPYAIWADANPEDYEGAEFRRVMSMRFVPDRDGRNWWQTDGRTEQRVWLKSTEPLPDDPLLHVCALAYASDLTLAPTAALDIDKIRMLRDGPGPTRAFLTSLDHAMWFHRPFRADEWLLFEQRSPSAGDGRGLSLGDFWNRDGHLVATVVQESVLRRRRDDS